MSDQDLREGYNDGFQADALPPGPNRSRSYVHGWLNGRDDRIGKPRATASVLRDQAKRAKLADAVDFFAR